MSKQCQDTYSVQFNLFPEMLSYHEDLRRRSRWVHTSVKSLEVVPLDKNAPLFSDHAGFDAEVSEDAIADTANHLGLAVKVDGCWFPLRDTSYPSLLDRAKINGTALPKLSREKLSGVLNTCLPLHKAEALMLIRDEKVSAAHSGDTKDYSVLEIDQLLDSLQAKVDERFPGNVFTGGYSDHAITSASWSLPGQKRELLDTYVQSITLDRKYGPDRGPDTKKERETAEKSLAQVVQDYRKRFSSFKPQNEESYRSEVNRAVQTVLPAWLQMRDTYVPLKLVKGKEKKS